MKLNENTQTETIHRKTSRKTQVPMGRRYQERPEENETHKMDRTSPRSPQMERNCWESQDSTWVVAPSMKKNDSNWLSSHWHYVALNYIVPRMWWIWKRGRPRNGIKSFSRKLVGRWRNFPPFTELVRSCVHYSMGLTTHMRHITVELFLGCNMSTTVLRIILSS